MNPDQHWYIKRAISNYGVPMESGVTWFIDEGRVYYADVSNGEISNYLSGFVSGNTFLVEYTTDNSALDNNNLSDFIRENLELTLIDTR